MKKCSVCGKPISYPKRRYCCEQCRRIGCELGYGSKEPTIEQAEQIYERWKEVFGDVFTGKRIKKADAWKVRIFVWAAIELMECPQKHIAIVTHRDHTTIMHHYENIRWNEKIIADEFYRNPKYKFKKMPIYPPDFKYVDNDK